jgi:hypothetical protein
MMIPPETHDQTSGGILMKSVLTLRRSVKRITEMPSDSVTMNAFFLPSSDPPTMTGKSGSTQGASTVRIPAKNEMTKIIIYIQLARIIPFMRSTTR